MEKRQKNKTTSHWYRVPQLCWISNTCGFFLGCCFCLSTKGNGRMVGSNTDRNGVVVFIRIIIIIIRAGGMCELGRRIRMLTKLTAPFPITCCERHHPTSCYPTQTNSCLLSQLNNSPFSSNAQWGLLSLRVYNSKRFLFLFYILQTTKNPLFFFFSFFFPRVRVSSFTI
jgi:hypothetical protein